MELKEIKIPIIKPGDLITIVKNAKIYDLYNKIKTDEQLNTIEKGKAGGFCPSVIFDEHKHRKSQYITGFTGLYGFDLDVKETFLKSGSKTLIEDDEKSLIQSNLNKYIEQFGHKFLMICKSRSGCGIRIIAKGNISNSIEEYKYRWQVINDEIKEYIDENIFKLDAVKDPVRIFYLSHDQNAFWNNSPTDYDIEFIPFVKQESVSSNNTFDISETKITTKHEIDPSVLDDILKICQENNISLSPSYNDWIILGWTLIQNSPDKSFYYFDEFSKIDKSYNSQNVSNKYDELKNSIELTTNNYGLAKYIKKLALLGYKFNQFPQMNIIDELEDESINSATFDDSIYDELPDMIKIPIDFIKQSETDRRIFDISLISLLTSISVLFNKVIFKYNKSGFEHKCNMMSFGYCAKNAAISRA